MALAPEGRHQLGHGGLNRINPTTSVILAFDLKTRNRMEPNPYQAFVTPAAIVSEPPAPPDSLLRDWEHRRLWFNGILIPVTVLLGAVFELMILQPRFWFLAVQLAFIANVCFCAGPVVTWYLTRLRFKQRAAGVFLFWTGTVLSVLLTTAALLSEMMRTD